jgi:uncharacterized protein
MEAHVNGAVSTRKLERVVVQLEIASMSMSQASRHVPPSKLVDVGPDGFCANVAEGIIRARYRDGFTREVLLTPGEPTELTVDLWHAAHTFLPGHAIRLEVSSSSFPRWDRNLNCATSPGLAGPEELQVAFQQVLHDPAHPSRLVLPVVG